MNFILAFLFFGGVIAAATGKNLKCVTCEVIQNGATNCEGEVQECGPDTYKCSSEIELNKLNENLITTVRKRCLPNEYAGYCDHQFKLDSKGLNITQNTECCDNADGCNSNPIQMQPVQNKPNGHQCPTCFAQGALQCTPTEQDCFDDQTDCINYSGSAARPGQEAMDYAVQGCITYGACMLNFDGLSGTKVYSKDYTCTPA